MLFYMASLRNKSRNSKESRILQPSLLQIPGNMIILPQCLLNSTGFQWEKWIVFKILFLTFQCLHGLALSYLSDLIVKKHSLWLHSDNQLELVLPRTHLVTYGNRAFSAAAANLWNSIPVATRLCNTLTTLKICIKTYLFILACPINQWFYQAQNTLCCQVLLIKNVMVVVMCFYPNFILCVLFIVQRFWVLQKKARYKFGITLHIRLLQVKNGVLLQICHINLLQIKCGVIHQTLTAPTSLCVHWFAACSLI